jgi:hypothetical protein
MTTPKAMRGFGRLEKQDGLALGDERKSDR